MSNETYVMPQFDPEILDSIVELSYKNLLSDDEIRPVIAQTVIRYFHYGDMHLDIHNPRDRDIIAGVCAMAVQLLSVGYNYGLREEKK